MVTLSPSSTGSTLPSTPSPTARSRYRIPESVRTSLVPSYLPQQTDSAHGTESQRCTEKCQSWRTCVTAPPGRALAQRPKMAGRIPHQTRSCIEHPTTFDTLLSASSIAPDHKHITLRHLPPAAEQAPSTKSSPAPECDCFYGSILTHTACPPPTSNHAHGQTQLSSATLTPPHPSLDSLSRRHVPRRRRVAHVILRSGGVGRHWQGRASQSRRKQPRRRHRQGRTTRDGRSRWRSSARGGGGAAPRRDTLCAQGGGEAGKRHGRGTRKAE